MAGTVSSRVLSSGPALLVFSSLVVSSLGTLKPPGSSLLVAVLSRRPARKNDATSATPATIMSRLNTQDMAFLALDLWTLYFFMTSGIVTSTIRLARSTLCGQVLPDTPLVPRAVVVGQPLVTEPVQGKEGDRGRDPAVAVGDDRLVSILGHTRLLQLPRQLFIGVEGTALGVEEAVGVEVGGPWYTPRPGLPSHHSTGVLPLVARIENESVAPLAGGEEAFGVRPPAAPRIGGEVGRLRFGDFGGGRTILGRPLPPAAVEDKDPIVTVVSKGPPETCGELATRVVVGDHLRIISDAERAHELRETFRRCDLHRHGVVGVGDVTGPVNVDGAWDVGLVVLLAGSEILGLLAASAEVRLVHVTPDIHDAQLLVIEMCGEPVGSDEGVHLLLLQDVVLAGVGLGQPAGSVFVIFAETSFDHLVLQVVF